MYWSVDRIEEGYAVCENDDGECINIELSLLPFGVIESDILKICDGKYYIDKEETHKRRKVSLKLQNDVINKNIK